MKRKFRIGGAVLIGALLVLGAFVINKATSQTVETGEVVAVVASERNPLETKDLNNNGIADWKEDLGATVFETIQVPPSDTATGTGEKYVPPSTFTGQFSIALYSDYLDEKSWGNEVDSEAFVGSAIQAIERSTEAKKHTRLEFTIVDSTQEALRAYGNDLVTIVVSHPLSGDADVEILKEALDKDDPVVLKRLDPIIEAYQSTLNDMLKMNVPSELAAKHLELVNGYEAVLANIVAMKKVLDDPLFTLARIRNYGKDGSVVIDVVRSISKQLTESGITYPNDEPGSGLYFFDI